MKHFALLTAWTLLFFLLLLGVDQFFLRIPVEIRGLQEIQTFYLDFRSRALSPFQESAPAEPRSPGPPKTAPAKTKKTGPKKGPLPNESPHYVYADEQGHLQFADTLDEVPAKYRREARPLTP